MRNVVGIVLVSGGVALTCWPFSRTVALVLAGLALLAGGLLLVIDWDGR